jgi:hypothetical protein
MKLIKFLIYWVLSLTWGILNSIAGFLFLLFLVPYTIFYNLRIPKIERNPLRIRMWRFGFIVQNQIQENTYSGMSLGIFIFTGYDDELVKAETPREPGKAEGLGLKVADVASLGTSVCFVSFC